MPRVRDGRWISRDIRREHYEMLRVLADVEARAGEPPNITRTLGTLIVDAYEALPKKQQTAVIEA